MPRFQHSEAMTSITAPSFFDDAGNVERHMRCGGRWDINAWLQSTPALASTLSMTDTSAYTGSVMDDAADMLPLGHGARPGFGRIDKKFYSEGKRGKDEREWTEEMAKAVGGDIQRSLARLGGFGEVRVMGAEEGAREKRRAGRKKRAGGEEDEDRCVRVRAPPAWGSFVIEGKDGRVIVVDKDDVYDSGRPGENIVVDWGRTRSEKEMERQRKKDERRKKEKEKEQAISLALKLRSPDAKLQDKSWSNRNTELAQQDKPILEADTSDDASVIDSNVPSPTKFFITGGASGWHSPLPSPVKPPASPTRPPPSSWPSPIPSPVKRSSVSTWGTKLPVKSGLPSAVESVDTRKEHETWDEGVSTVKPASLVGSHGSSRIVSSRHSSNRSVKGSDGRATWTQDGEDVARPILSPSRSDTSRVSSHVASRGSWTWDADDFYRGSLTTVVSREPSPAKSGTSWGKPTSTYSTHSRTSSRSTRSRARSTTTAVAGVKQIPGIPTSTHSSTSSHSSRKTWASRTPSFSAWNALTTTEDDTKSKHSSQKGSVDGSQASTIQPFSWRREIDDESTHSTNGSPGSRSVAGASAWQADHDDTETWKQDTDARSVRSTQSVYRRPTVEDAPDTPTEEKQEWVTGWTENASDKTVKPGSNSGWGAKDSDAGKSSTWNGSPSRSASGWARGSQHGSNGSVKSERDKSGYSEDNETWLNTEVGGVRFREAEWRRPENFTWRDV
ncbi:hypothetical protein K458DRAFT_430839 [Lentithecium fluviatile CBS 122367]|uniref:Uncharacterized protein n=1 Tax=Lentithecium fluviatile CBS 122367 TaxID=1168545 RepID=A0A6G1J591_9PLEO|nr:hypothetical protein K458DRAFT_430839 [Lentithecium fluviatile CBS 122367]